MVATNQIHHDAHEEQIARLTQAAYHAVLERGFRGSFLDLELSLWNAMRFAVQQEVESQSNSQAA